MRLEKIHKVGNHFFKDEIQPSWPGFKKDLNPDMTTLNPQQIINQIENAGAWLPLTVVRQAFTQHESLTPIFLERVRQRAVTKGLLDIRQQRLAAFGLFFLAQHRDPRTFDPLVQLFESVDSEQQDEWLFASRLFFFSHRLLAGACPSDARRVMELALDSKKNPFTRSIGLCAIGMLAAYGDISRAEAVQLHRQLFKMVQNFKHRFMDGCWARAATKLHSAEFERELQWFLASGRLDSHDRSIIAGAMRSQHEENFATIVALEPLVDIFFNIFPQDMRDGEVGLLPNGQIPNLHRFTETESEPRTN
jgi:hypothetical protein